MSEKLQQIVEKIKSMDRKTLIGIGVGAVVVIVAIIVLVVALTGNKPASVDGTEGTETATEAATETLFETVDGTETTETTEMESTETTELEEVTEGEYVEPEVVSGGGTVNGVEQLQVVVNPETGKEVMGAGSASQPYMEIPDLNTMSVTTVQVPAGTVIYYQIQRIAGLYCTISDSSAYVIDAYGTRHNPSGGAVSFKVQDGLSSDYITLQIGNSGSTAKSFTLKFSNPTGSFNNPTVLSTAQIMGGVVTQTGQGADEGYWYAYVAETSGVLYFKVTGCSASVANISVTNTVTMENRTVSADGVVGADGLVYIAVNVNPGDLLQINVGVEPQNWDYPAATITWLAYYQKFINERQKV